MTNPLDNRDLNTQNEEQDNDEIDLRELWAVLKRRQGTIALIAVVIFIGTLIATLMMTPIYRANATLQINTEEQKVLNFGVEAGNSRPVDSKDFYQTQYELLKSRTLARMTIDDLSLESALKGEQLAKPFFTETLNNIKTSIYGEEKQDENTTAPGKLGEYPVEDKFLENLTVAPVKNSQIVIVSYDHTDPQMATTITNSLADNFIKMNLGRRKEAASYAENFLKNELADAKSKLEESEAKLVKFAKKETIIHMDDEKQGSLTSQKMGDLNTALTEAEKDRITAESKFKQAQATGASKTLDNPTIQELKKNLAKLQGDFQEKLQIYKPGYPIMVQLQNQISELQAQINQEVSSIGSTITGSLQGDYLAAKQKENELRTNLDKQQNELLTLRDKSIGYNTLQREVETNRNMYEGLLQRIKEIGVAGGIGTNNISVVDPALVPYQKHKPNTKLNLALGLVLGLFLGTVVAFLIEFIDDRVKSSSDLERLLGLPLLGVTPAMKDKNTNVIDYSMASFKNPTSAIAESFRSLRTNLLFATRDGLPRSLNITSSLPSEAKSSTCINLATVLAQSGKRVLLVDADLRKPTAHQRFKLDNSVGLTSYLTHQADAAAVIQSTPIEGVSVITAGPLSPNPVELLSSERLQELFALVPEQFDIVILDSPPTIGLSDALLISNRVSATIMVAAFAQSKKRALLDSIKRLRQAHANVIGMIFTKVKGSDGSGYGYDYNYYYSYGAHRSPDGPHDKSGKHAKKPFIKA
jgi:capsular exopolysaccharide synthesis family protein